MCLGIVHVGGIETNRSPGDNVNSTHQLHQPETSRESAKKSKANKPTYRWTLDEWLGRHHGQAGYHVIWTADGFVSSSEEGVGNGTQRQGTEIGSTSSQHGGFHWVAAAT